MNNFYRDLYDEQTRKSGKMATLIGFYVGVLEGIEKYGYTNEDIKKHLETGEQMWRDIFPNTTNTTDTNND